MLAKFFYLKLFSTTLLPSIYSITRMSSSQNSGTCTSSEPASIHSASIDETYNIPMKDIARPLPSVLDENKVLSLMETIQVIIINLLI